MVQDGILSVLPAWVEPYLRIDELPRTLSSISLFKMQYTTVDSLVKVWPLGDIKVGFLSEVHTDFVIAGITEEIGLFGLMGLTSIMFMIIGEYLK